MAKEDKKDFNTMLHDGRDMPKIQIISDPAMIQKYGGSKMFYAPPIEYDRLMKQVPFGRLVTVGQIRAWLAEKNGGDFTEPLTAGLFIGIAAWASHQREEDVTPYWRTLKSGGELNQKYPGGAEAQAKLLEEEGHVVLKRGRKHIRYYVRDYEKVLYAFYGK